MKILTFYLFATLNPIEREQNKRNFITKSNSTKRTKNNKLKENELKNP
jgi:hypothetical protein